MKPNIEVYACDPLAFFRSLRISTAYGPRQFGVIAGDFQLAFLQALSPSLLAVAKGEKPPKSRFWLEWIKGTGKDSIMGMALLWLLVFGQSALEMFASAGDQMQASETRKIIRDLLRCNSWISEIVQVFNWDVRNIRTESKLSILACDGQRRHGSRPHVTFINELVHVADGEGQEFVETLLDNQVKVPSGLLVVGTNAGFTGSWQYKLREAAREDPDRWHFSKHIERPPWISEVDLRERKRQTIASRYARLWEGRWVSGSGDALDPNLIEDAVCQIEGMTGQEEGWSFYLGGDLSTSKDLTSLCVLGQNEEKVLRLADVVSWRPSKHSKIEFASVETELLNLYDRFRPVKIFIDDHEAQSIAQRLYSQGLPVEIIKSTSSNLPEMAGIILERFRMGLVELYPHEGLLKDLHELRLVDKGTFIRLDSPRSAKTGHGDMATSFILAALAAHRHPRSSFFHEDEMPVVLIPGGRTQEIFRSGSTYRERQEMWELS
jgi:hypothetical protein